MPRRRALLSAFALACASSFAQAGAAVDLDAPGALAMLARERPHHYATIQRVLREADRRPTAGVARLLATELGARDVDPSALLKTSFTAKRRLAFTLDDTRYEILLVERASPWTLVR